MTQPVTYAHPAHNGYVPAAFVPAARRVQGISVLGHGFQKAGKSSLGDTGPRPTLIMDTEVAAFWTPSRKVYWQPDRETVPTWPADPRAAHEGNPDGLWDTCVVLVRDYATLTQVMRVLNTGQHPFNSISVDSVPNIQQRVMQALAGDRKMERDQWGVLLRQTMNTIMSVRDMLTHPTNPVWSVMFICGTHFDQRTGRYRPYLAGQASDLVPYQPDLQGWVYVADDGTRHLWSGPSKTYETGERLWGRLPYDMQLGYPGIVPGWTLETMVQAVIASR